MPDSLFIALYSRKPPLRRGPREPPKVHKALYGPFMFKTTPIQNELKQYYHGDDYVESLFVSVYGKQFSTRQMGLCAQYNDLRLQRSLFDQSSKPIMFAECGCC
jgi:beta-mannanase